MKELLENHGEGEFYKNRAVKLAVKSRYISRKTMEHSLFHILWKTSSTICGESLPRGREIPRYVEERIMRLFTANSILVCN